MELSAAQIDRIVRTALAEDVGAGDLTTDAIVPAEARCRVAFGLSLLSAGTPMFFMGEEIGARQPYRFNDFLSHREDLTGERAGNGARLFRFYQDLIRFSRRHPATRAQAIDVVHALGATRVIAFTRAAGTDRLLVVASLRNQPFLDGYAIQTEAWRLPDGAWREAVNSDAADYGGRGIGNFGAAVPAAGGRIQVRVPANGLLIFQKV